MVGNGGLLPTSNARCISWLTMQYCDRPTDRDYACLLTDCFRATDFELSEILNRQTRKLSVSGLREGERELEGRVVKANGYKRQARVGRSPNR